MKQATLSLPWPPSTNHIWKRSKRGNFLSREALSFRKEVWAEWIRAGRPRFSYAVTVTIIGSPPDKRKRDLDNIIKPLLDALVACGCLPDDSLAVVRELRISAGHAGGGALEVTICGT